MQLQALNTQNQMFTRAKGGVVKLSEKRRALGEDVEGQKITSPQATKSEKKRAPDYPAEWEGFIQACKLGKPNAAQALLSVMKQSKQTKSSRTPAFSVCTPHFTPPCPFVSSFFILCLFFPPCYEF